jgi:hypothetical protein
MVADEESVETLFLGLARNAEDGFIVETQMVLDLDAKFQPITSGKIRQREAWLVVSV